MVAWLKRKNGNVGFHPLTICDKLSSFNEFAADRERRKL
jgi:hypothetical protein